MQDFLKNIWSSLNTAPINRPIQPGTIGQGMKTAADIIKANPLASSLVPGASMFNMAMRSSPMDIASALPLTGVASKFINAGKVATPIVSDAIKASRSPSAQQAVEQGFAQKFGSPVLGKLENNPGSISPVVNPARDIGQRIPYTNTPITKSSPITNDFANTTPGNTIIRQYPEFTGQTTPNPGQVRPNVGEIRNMPSNNTGLIYRNAPAPSPNNAANAGINTAPGAYNVGEPVNLQPITQSPVGKPPGFYNSTNPADTIVRSYPEFQGQTQPTQQMIDQAGQIRSNMNVLPSPSNNPSELYGNGFNVPVPSQSNTLGNNFNVGEPIISQPMASPMQGFGSAESFPGAGVFDVNSGFGAMPSVGTIGNGAGMEGMMGGMNSPVGSMGDIGNFSGGFQPNDMNYGGGGGWGY